MQLCGAWLAKAIENPGERRDRNAHITCQASK
jgi:hypothetical protein